ncbi:MAG: hypothetical protein ACTSQJ_11585 [Promethearchaeota archaeon]
MSDDSEGSMYDSIDREKFKKTMAERESDIEILEKDFIPNFFPTFRIKGKLYPLPIIIVVICAGVLAYFTYVVAGVQIEGGYVSESEHGAAAGLINGLIFTLMAALSAFAMIFLVKKFGLNVLKYIFGASFGFLGFILTVFFAGIFIYLIFIQIPYSDQVGFTYLLLMNYILPICAAIFISIIIYKYFTSESFYTKNFIVLYIGLLIGAFMGVIMPLWTTVAILLGISFWDIFAVKHKRGPIKEMIDIASRDSNKKDLSEEKLKEKIESGDLIYDTSKLEIGIGDLAFYSMLTSAALIQTENLFIMFLTAAAIIIGTGITISGLKRNKILPGLPISIFLGIGVMLSSWAIITFIFI